MGVRGLGCVGRRCVRGGGLRCGGGQVSAGVGCASVAGVCNF